MRGRKIRAGDSSCILFMRHKTSCPEYGNNSPTLECDCIKVVPISRREPPEHTRMEMVKGGRRYPANAQEPFGSGGYSPSETRRLQR
jgi:hypothetical protein